MKTTIIVSGIECYSFHGCLDEESKIGGRFSVDVAIEKDIEQSVYNDELHDTVDYVMVHEVVRDQMTIASKLIEHAGGRILKELSLNIPGEKVIEVKITKFNPPVNGQINSAAIILREEYI